MAGCKNRLSLWIVVLAVSGLLTGLVSRTASGEEDRTPQIEKLFREAIDFYQQGKYSESQLSLRKVLELDPRKELAARLIDEAGTKIISQMMTNSRLGYEPTKIWELYKQYYVGKLANKERMAKMAQRLVDAKTTEDERAQLYTEFTELAHYGVPFLAPFLKDANHEDHIVYARIAIARMGSRAVLPMIELLNHPDEFMRENAILTLADIQPLDPRAIPALKARAEDPNEKPLAKHFAERTLQRITGLAPTAMKSASAYYYVLADRYYLDRTGVSEEAEEVDGLVWHLNPSGELVPVQYPLWAWNDQMAEENVLRGMAINSDYVDFYPLWACIQGAEYTEVKDLLDIVNEQPSLNTFSAEEKKEIEIWDKKLIDTHRLAAAVGKEHCNAALAKVHTDLLRSPGHGRLPQVGAFLGHLLVELDPLGKLLTPPPDFNLQVLPGKEPLFVKSGGALISIRSDSTIQSVTVKPDSMEIVAVAAVAPVKGKEVVPVPVLEPVVLPPPVSNSSLVNGLDSPDESIQYACAISLAEIDRFPTTWIGNEKVARILGRGISESKAIQILLIEESPNESNALRQRFESLGYGVTTAVSGREGMLLARSFPPKDIAVVAANLRRDLSAEQVFEELRADVRTRYLPIGVLHARNDRLLVQSRFGTEISLLERESEGNDLKVSIEGVAAKRAVESVPKRKAHEISVKCAQALTKIDPRSTYLQLDDAVEHANNALFNRPDDVRIPAAIFLGRIEGGSKKEAVAESLKTVFLDANNAVELRRSALLSLGRVQKEGLEELYLKAQSDPDQEIKDIAAKAFGLNSRANILIKNFVSQQRVDKDHKEK